MAVAPGGVIQILDPTGEVEARELPLATRLETLDQSVIGLLDNSKPNAGAFLSRVEHLLVFRRYAICHGFSQPKKKLRYC